MSVTALGAWSSFRPCARRAAFQSSAQQCHPLVGPQNPPHLSKLQALGMLESEMDVNTFWALSVAVPPNLKDELLVRRNEWDKAKSLLDNTFDAYGSRASRSFANRAAGKVLAA